LADSDETKTGSRYDDIIQAAINVFSRTNYDNATTAMIASEAGIAEGTTFRYFKSKKELFLACYKYVERVLIERYVVIYEETKGEPVEYLHAVARSYLEFLRENPNMRKFLAFVLNNSFDPDFLSELDSFVGLNVRAVESMLKKAIRQGDLDKGFDAKAAAWLFVGGYFTMILMDELGAPEIDDPHFADRLIDLVFK